MDPAEEPTKEDWNSDDPLPSTSVFDISLRLVVNNLRKNTTISGLNFQVTYNAFDRSNAGEDTVNVQSVPSNENISFNTTGEFCTPESSIQQSPREHLKKSNRKSVHSTTKTTGSKLPSEMESSSLKQNKSSIENNANGFSSTEQRKISVNHFQNTPSTESKLNTSVKYIESQGCSDHKPTDSTSSIQSHHDTISSNRSVALNRISLVSESQINRSPRISENQGSSQFGADNNSPLKHNSLSEYANVPKHVQSNLGTVNEGEKGKESHNSKQLKAQAEAITKGNQVIANIRVNKTANQQTQEKEVNQIGPVKPIENKITNRNPLNNNEISNNNDLTEVRQQFENLLISEKQNINNNIADVARPNNANTSPTKTDNVNKQGIDLSMCEERRKESMSYNINNLTELEGSMQRMNVSLPSQSTSKIANIVPIDSDKNKLKQTKENLSQEKIDMRINSPIIKKEKSVKEEYNSSRKDASKNPPTNKNKPSPVKRNSKESTKTNKNSEISKTQVSRRGTYASSTSSSSSDETSVTDSYTTSSCSSSDESTTGTCTSLSISSSSSDEDTSGSEMSSSSSSDECTSDFDSESCSCSDCEEYSCCSCSDCVSDSSSSCSCSACCDSESDYSCTCRCYRIMTQRHR